MARAQTLGTRAPATAAFSSTADAGKLLLRVVLGVLILLHGISKVIAGPAFIIDTVTRDGLPAALAYGVYVGEVAAPLLLIAGVWTRVAAALVAINMVFAVLLVHTADLLKLSKTGGLALELQGLFLAAAIAVALLGAGRYSVGGTLGRWN